MFTAFIFIIILGILVLVHELGHFVMAKRAGMKVEEFGFGFPPRLFSFKKRETVYSINGIPFGGFVKILGEDGEEKANHRSFSSKSLGARTMVIVAGVAMNVVLAFGLLVWGNMYGLRMGFTGEITDPKIRDLRVQIVQVAQNSPAEQAGLEMLDEIVSFRVAGREVSVKSVQEVQSITLENKGRTIGIKLKRGEELIEKEITPRLNPPSGEGAVGISLVLTGLVRYSWYESIYQGARQTIILMANTFMGYAQIVKSGFMTGSPGAELSGPVGIARFTGQAARAGFIYVLQLMALLSVNLAVLNIMPFPALDGGRLLFLIIEKIKGSPLPKRAEQLANSIGFSLLILLMIYVTTKDILRFL